MGGKVSKRGRNFSEKYVMHLKEKVKGLQEKIREVTYEKENESRSYEREIMVFTIKEADWKQEWKKMREEVKQLRKLVEEKEEKIREMEGVEKNSEKEWELMGTKVLVEKMKEERARRDEAVEKWKQLYLAIKIELDELIQRTIDGFTLILSLLFLEEIVHISTSLLANNMIHHKYCFVILKTSLFTEKQFVGDGLYLKTEENDIQMENLKWELQDKEETIKSLKAQLVSMEEEKKKKEREFDLLRQSLRIMNGKKNSLLTKQKFLKSKVGR